MSVIKKGYVFTLLCLVCIGALAAMLVSGCSSKTAGGGGDKVIKIASASPLSGSQAAFGDDVRMGVEMAVKELTPDLEKLGFKVEFIPQDDQADPKMGVSIAQKLVTDPDVLAVAGHMNSGVTIPSSEVYAKANLAMYTPIATNPNVTDRNLPNVGRVCGRDDNQGKAAAMFAAKNLNAKTYFVVQDQTSYGQGIADEFVKKADALGIKKLGYEGITQGEVDFSAVVNKIVASNPDVVYFGGMYPEGGVVIKQMRSKGSKAAFIACDGCDSAEYTNIAGAAVDGTYYTTMAPDLSQTDAGKAWVAKYKSEFNKEPEAYSMYSYDDGLAVMKGLIQAINDNGGKKPTRQQVCDAIRKVTFTGITSDVSFDSKGDNVNAKSFVMKFSGSTYPGQSVAVFDIKSMQ